VEEDIKFLRWLGQRLIHLHGYNANDTVVFQLNKAIKNFLSPPKISMSNNDLDKIISKYYVDFYLEKQEDNNFNVGFSDQERNNLRKTIRDLVTDIMNFNVPKEPIIKDK
jgi:hypothetical protein